MLDGVDIDEDAQDELIDPEPRVSSEAPTQPWLQLDVALRSDGRTLRRDAWTVIDRVWQASGDAWFVRKSPGLRVRLAAAGPAVADAVAATLERLRADGRIDGWSRGVYEAETYRFGGQRAMAVAHRAFAVSAEAWRSLVALRLERISRVPTDTVGALLFDRFVADLTQDDAERWDVWCRVVDGCLDERPRPGRPSERPSRSFEHVLDAAAPTELDAIERALDGLQACAGQLLACSERAVGPRAFAATLAPFHWNIWCVGRTRLREVCRERLTALDPHRGADER